jgi:serine/threonine protein kinase
VGRASNLPERLQELHKLKIIDFGLSTKWCDENGKHLARAQMNSFKGNLIFGSKNAFRGQRLSRRDDLISLAYLLVYIVDGDLEFMKGQCEDGEDNASSNSDEFIKIGKGKLNMTPEDICPSAESRELVPFIQEVYSLGFSEEPNYSKLNFLLVKILMNANVVPDNQYEWNKIIK